MSQTWFYNMAAKLGPMGESTVFLWEYPQEGFEGGMDWIAVGGQYSDMALIGYEIKDSCYVSTVKPYGRISPKLRDSADAMRDWFDQVGYRNMVSTEVRITENGTAYMIDLAARFPWPPCGTQMENIINLGEVMWYAGEGVLVQPEYQFQYAVELNIIAPAVQQDWMAVEIPDAERRWFKLHSACKFGDTYWLRSQKAHNEQSYAGTVLGQSNDFKQAVELCIDRSKLIKGQDLKVDVSDIEKAEEEIADGEAAGIPFWS